MTCSHCNQPGHNKRRCPLIHNIAPASEIRAAKSLSKLLDQKPEVKKSPAALEGLAGCKNIWREPAAPKVKKSPKALEGLAGCRNIWKDVPAYKLNAKKSPKALEGLAGCKNLWKETPVERVNKGNTTCKLCDCKGHNARTCPTTSKMPECVECSDKPMWMLEYKASIIQRHMRGWNIRTAQRKTEQITFANGKTINIDLGC